MSQVFDLTEIVNKSLSTTKKPAPSSDNRSTVPVSRKEKPSYSSKVWVSFFFALASSVLLTTVIIEQSKVATKIMNQVRIAEKNSHPALLPDTSSLTLTTDTGMVALVKLPTGERVGVDHRQIRFFESSTASISRINANPKETDKWSIFLQRPPSGIYQMDFSVNKSDTYEISFQSNDRTGTLPTTYQYQNFASANQLLRYHFQFDKENFQNTRILDIQTLPIK